MKDELFLRGAQVPMTKEAVRALALAKLELHRARHLIDIGAGTGSVSIEAALQNPALRVTAIERQADRAAPAGGEPAALWLRQHRYRGGRCAAGGRRQSRRDLYGGQRRPPDGADRLVAGAAASWRPAGDDFYFAGKPS